MLENNSINNEEIPIFAVDTNVVLAMYHIKHGSKEKNLDRRYKQRYKEVSFLLQLLEEKKIQLVILSRVFAEINISSKKANPKVIKFVKSGLFLKPSLKAFNETKYNTDIRQVGNVYAHYLSYKNFLELTKNNPNVVYNPKYSMGIFDFTTTGKPKNDAFIMAEAALHGLTLITLDFKDFIKENKDKTIAYKNSILNLSQDALPISCGRACQQLCLKYNIPYSKEDEFEQMII